MNYDLMADFHAIRHDGLERLYRYGRNAGLATHMIGHELTALHGLTHGATLAIVLPEPYAPYASRKRARSRNTANGYGVSIVERQKNG